MNRKAKALEFVNEGYNIKITGRHVEVTDFMKNYAMEKISRIERFTNRIIDVNVIMDIQKLEHRAEIILKLDHIKITSQASSDDMYISIDQAVNKIETQLRRYKQKIQNHHAKKGMAVIDMNVNVLRRPRYEEDDLDMETELESITEANEYRVHEVVKQESMPLKVLTYDEAIMKMELSGDVFLIFKNEEDQKLKVIYRREDDDYGIIEPQL
jgi:putative sigma-54 modulation protein